jgi:ribose/xylose/arabinose/galactoside ABC-type transport system permease subunit
VIGGANLMGGEGGAFGAFVGAALLEVIRNSLLMAGRRFQLARCLCRHLHRSRGAS